MISFALTALHWLKTGPKLNLVENKYTNNRTQQNECSLIKKDLFVSEQICIDMDF